MSRAKNITISTPVGDSTRRLLQILLDTSASTHDEMPRIAEMLNQWLSSLKENPVWLASLDLSLITFGKDVRRRNLRYENVVTTTLLEAFTPLAEVRAQTLTDTGPGTPMVQAISDGLDLLRDYKAHLRARGADFYRPFQILIADGQPLTDRGHSDVDGMAKLIPRLISEQNDRHVLFRAVGIPGANAEILAQLAGSASAVTEIGRKDRELDLTRLLAAVSNSVESALGGQAAHPRGHGDAPGPSRGGINPAIEREHEQFNADLAEGEAFVASLLPDHVFGDGGTDAH